MKTVFAVLALGLFACSSSAPATGAAPSEAVSDSFYGRVIEAGCERIEACEPAAFAAKYASTAACSEGIEAESPAADLTTAPKCGTTAQAECVSAFATLDCAALLNGTATTPAACGGC